MMHYDDIIFYNDLKLDGSPRGIKSVGRKKNNIIYSSECRSTDIIYRDKSPDLKIIIIRDPLNWAASVIKRVGSLSLKFDDVKIDSDKCLERYKESYALYKSSDYYGINYNKWFIDYNYRRSIESDLSLIETDNGINKVMEYGSGSSFDGLEYNGKASQMKTLERWLEYKNNIDIQKILEDKFFQEILANEFNIKY